MTSRIPRISTLCLILTVFVATACDRGKTPTELDPDPDPVVTPIRASDWVDFVDWDQATIQGVGMVETTSTQMAFVPNEMTFEAGKPYILRITNQVGNDSKHYFSPEGLSSFYQAIATRKAQTEDAEYKAPYFDAVELKLDGTIEIYFVPVLAGTYQILCTIPGHKDFGMTATITITGGEGYALDLEVPADFNTALTADPRKSGSHEVWENAVEKTVSMHEEGSALSFAPPDISLTEGIGYKLTLENPASHGSKHYYTAADFYKTVVWRKADDSQAEVKAPYMKAIELIIGGSTTLFIVPTEVGDFNVLCTIAGHAAAGMTGTIAVAQFAQTPVSASDWVSFVDWDAKEVVEVNMVESGGSLSYSPNELTFEAGKPYVLRIINSASNEGKHYFSPEGLSFYQAIATRKAQTADAEYKAPYFDAVELKIGGVLDIYFVPVLAGTYDVICTIPGHKALGMTATATITGGDGYQLDLEVDPDFNVALTTDERKSGSHAVWSTATELTVSMFEGDTSFGFIPPDLSFTKDVGYKLTLENSGDHGSKHYYTAAAFYQTVVLRKGDDTQAEIKAPYFKAIELIIGGSTTLFIVPTQVGTYEVLCTITGHAAAGMTGTLTVGAG